MGDEMNEQRASRWIWWAAAGVLFVGLVVVWASIRPLAPWTVSILTGPENSNYHDAGLRFRGELDRWTDGVRHASRNFPQAWVRCGHMWPSGGGHRLQSPDFCGRSSQRGGFRRIVELASSGI